LHFGSQIISTMNLFSGLLVFILGDGLDATD
jgi:hypothetical protein